MSISRLGMVAVLVLSTVGPVCAQQADSVFKDGRIYTVDEDKPWAEALAISDGKLIAVGNTEDMNPLIGETTEVIDLDGAFMMPGIQENHVHASSAGATILKYANRATFSPDSQTLAVVGGNNRIQLFSVATGEQVQLAPCFPSCLAFGTPSGHCQTC